jgi:hypothetical protein
MGLCLLLCILFVYIEPINIAKIHKGVVSNPISNIMIDTTLICLFGLPIKFKIPNNIPDIPLNNQSISAIGEPISTKSNERYKTQNNISKEKDGIKLGIFMFMILAIFMIMIIIIVSLKKMKVSQNNVNSKWKIIGLWVNCRLPFYSP